MLRGAAARSTRLLARPAGRRRPSAETSRGDIPSAPPAAPSLSRIPAASWRSAALFRKILGANLPPSEDQASDTTSDQYLEILR